MPTYIALLRGINVGGHNKIAMTQLKVMLESMGLANAKTWLQSGNVVFETKKQSPAALEKSLETATKSQFDLSIDYVVRTAAEWKKVIAANPFQKEAKTDPSHMVVAFMKSSPKPEAVKSLRAGITGPEQVELKRNELYLIYPAGIGQSKLTNTVIEKKLGVRGTARNWNTILKLAALTQSDS